MLKINLEKELTKQKPKLVSDKALLAVQEYDKLASVLEKSDALQRIGITKGIDFGKQVSNSVAASKTAASKFDQSRVFHISQIKKICNRYHLRFLESGRYKGSIDPQLPLKIETFEAANGVMCNKYNTYIMAPLESFKLEKLPKDPLLFYQINEDYYYLVHKWGNDLNAMRRYLYPILSSALFTNLVIAAFVALLWYATTESYTNIVGNDIVDYILQIVSAALSVLYGIVVAAQTLNTEDTPLRFIPKNKWDSHYSE